MVGAGSAAGSLTSTGVTSSSTTVALAVPISAPPLRVAVTS